MNSELSPAERQAAARAEFLKAFDEFCPGVVGNPFIPQWPTPQQAIFLSLHRRNPKQAKVFEALFGGAAGGGKSSALLMALAQYVQHGTFSALALRRTLTELDMPGALLDRAREWWIPAGVKYNAQKHSFQFPSGAKVQFAYLEGASDHMRYQGAEFQLVVWDELSQWPTDVPYKYVSLSRARRNVGSQIPMRALSASNPGGPGHCVPYGEVLTQNGWVPIQSVAVGDLVYTVESDGSLSLEVVEQTHASRHSGKLIEINARGLHICGTENHKVARLGGTKKIRGAKFALEELSRLPGQAYILRSAKWAGRPLDSFAVPSSGRRTRGLQPKSITGRQHAELLGWFLSEGHAINHTGKRWFNISQRKAEQRASIKRLLDECGFKYGENENGFTVHDCDWAQYFYGFGLQPERFVPRYVLESSANDLSALFFALMDGDGHWQSRGRSGTYYTTSRQLADDVAEIAFKLGFVVSMVTRNRDDRRASYEVAFKTVANGATEILTGNHKYKVETTTKRKSDVRTYDADCDVFCIGVRRTHNFVIRQNGAVWVSGNSWVKSRFVTLDTRIGEFVPAKTTDNPHLDRETYIAGLNYLHPTLREQLLLGNWDAREPGQYFRREWFGPLLDPATDTWPAADCIRVRWWDLAASEKETAARTAGVRMARHRSGVRAIEHAVAFRKTPGARDDAIIQVAQGDGHSVTVGLEIEPGSGGIAQYLALEKRLRELGFRVVGARPKVERSDNEEMLVVRSTNNLAGKAGRAAPVASCLERGFQRRADLGSDPASTYYGKDKGRPATLQEDGLRIFSGPWTNDYMSEVEAFPDGATCDLVDATSGAWAWLETKENVFRQVPSQPAGPGYDGDEQDAHPEDRPESEGRSRVPGLPARRQRWAP